MNLGSNRQQCQSIVVVVEAEWWFVCVWFSLLLQWMMVIFLGDGDSVGTSVGVSADGQMFLDNENIQISSGHVFSGTGTFSSIDSNHDQNDCDSIQSIEGFPVWDSASKLHLGWSTHCVDTKSVSRLRMGQQRPATIIYIYVATTYRIYVKENQNLRLQP